MNRMESYTEDCVCAHTSSDRNVELVIHLHLVPRWKLRRTVPPPKYTFSGVLLAYAQEQLHLCFALSSIEQVCTKVTCPTRIREVPDTSVVWRRIFPRFFAVSRHPTLQMPGYKSSVETRSLSPISLPFHHSHTGIGTWFDSISIDTKSQSNQISNLYLLYRTCLPLAEYFYLGWTVYSGGRFADISGERLPPFSRLKCKPCKQTASSANWREYIRQKVDQTYQTTRRHIPEYSTLHSSCRENPNILFTPCLYLP
jgi:hypothetical protein